jgi:O-antigen ligase
VAVAFLAVGAITALLPSEARARVLTLTGVTTDQSGSYRIGVWHDTLHLVASSPYVGSGVGAYADALPRFKTAAAHLGIEHAESDYLEFLAEGGGLGVLLGGAAALVLFLYGLKGLRAEEHRLTRALLAAALAGGAAIYMHSAFDFNLRIPSNALMATFLAAVCTTGTLLASGPAAVGRKSVTPSAGLLVLVGSLLIALLSPWSEPRWDPAALARAAFSPRADLRRSSLESEVTTLLRRRPGQAAAWVHLAWLRLPKSPVEASALARWGVQLDPGHPELVRAAGPLSAAER